MEPNNNNNNQKPFNNNQNSNQNGQNQQKPQNNQQNQGGMQKPAFNSAVPQNKPNQQNNQKPQNNNQKSGKMKEVWGKVKAFFIKNKLTTLVILAIVVVILGAVFSNKKVAKAPEENTDKTAEVKDITKTPTVAVKELSYTDALKAYDGKTLTIGDSCVSVPAERTFAVGTRVLVNNIGRDPISFTLDQKSATINSYHYATTSLKNKGVFKLMCNGKEAVTVTVQ